jgi:hypothetical protein
MEPADQRRTNYVRRTVGVITCVTPIGLAVASLFGRRAQASLLVPFPLAFAAWVGLLNFHLSFVRPWLFKRRHESLEDCRFISGLPMIATLVVVLTVLADFGVRAVAVAALAILAVDTGGLPWFLITTWRQRELWDGAV